MAAAKNKKDTKVIPISAAKGTPEDKKKALDAAIARIEKQFGAGSVIRMGEKSGIMLFWCFSFYLQA